MFINHSALLFKLDLNGLDFSLLFLLEDVYNEIKLCGKDKLFNDDIDKCECIINITHSSSISCNKNAFQSLPAMPVYFKANIVLTTSSLFINDINNCLQEDP